MREMRVCVVDDCMDEAQVLCNALRMRGYQAEAVHTGTDALTRCGRGSVDLLLLDVGLPDLDGFEVCRRLKSDLITAGIPVIFVTARGSKDDVLRGFQLGASGYIAKPYNLPYVLAQVDAALTTQSATVFDEITQMEDTTYTDPLTGLRNRRYLEERLQEEIERARRYGFPVSCVLIELDDVVPTGQEDPGVIFDDLMTDAAIALRSVSRSFDVLARFDSFIFAVLLPHIGAEEARVYAQRATSEIEHSLQDDEIRNFSVTLYAGIVSSEGNGPSLSADEMIAAAHRELFRSKCVSRP